MVVSPGARYNAMSSSGTEQPLKFEPWATEQGRLQPLVGAIRGSAFFGNASLGTHSGIRRITRSKDQAIDL